MDTDPPIWSMTLPSDARLLTTLRSFVEAICQIGGFGEASISAIVLATHEAAHNIIRHAHGNDARAQLQIHCALQPDQMEIRLLDEGPLFDLEAVPPLDPSELRIGGRGIFLIRSLMDEVSCQPRGERGNCLSMIKRRTSRAATRDAC